MRAHVSRSLSRSALPTALALAFAVQACNCGDTLTLVPGSVKGKVCDPVTGEGVPGVPLVLDGNGHFESLADGKGEYIFDRVLPGEYTLTATLAPDVVRDFAVKVVADEIALVDDTACRGDPGTGDTGTLAGQICNRHTGELITDGEVIVTLADGGLMVTSTDATGAFELTSIPEGEHVVLIRGEGFQRAFGVEIVAGQTYELDLADDCDPPSATEGGIVGSFCDPTTEANLVGADVTIQLANGTGEIYTDVTDTNGAFEINGLAPDTYRVDVNSGSFSFTEPQVVVIAGDLSIVTDPNTCGSRPELGRIEGQICDAQAGGNFTGNVELISGVTVVASTVSDSTGRFAFNAIAAGTYTVRAFYPAGDPRGTYERIFSGIVVEPFRTAFIQEFDCPDPQDVCTEIENIPQQTADGRILLVVDRSGSMDQDDLGGNRKWDGMRQALKNVTQSLTGSVEFGLMLYPERNVVDFCQEGSQVIGLGLNTAGQIGSQLDSTSPQGGTPTAPTLATARDILAPLVSDGRPLAVLLATDGGPNCNASFADNNATCRCTDVATQGQCSGFNCLDDGNAVAAVGRIKDLGVNTYVIGVTGVENFKDVLNRMATVGGTALPTNNASEPAFYEANDQAALQAALEAITQRVLTCRIQTGANLNAVNSVTVRVGDVVLPRDSSRANGWDVTGDHSVELFGSACDVATASSDNVIIQTCIAP